MRAAVVGNDDLSRRANLVLEEQGVNVSAATRDAPQRRALTYVERDGERTITVIGEKLVPHATDPLPWADLAATDAVYFCGGDAEAVRLARRARVLVATARELETVREAGVDLDALVGSGRDRRERYEPGDLDPPPRLVAMTEGAEGGRYTADGEEGRWAAAPLERPLRDVYGAGDSFAAGLAYALADGLVIADALAFAARSAAHAMTVRGGGSPPWTARA